jgi:predicted TIM-barrel fold metal-dependent hydrolase
MVHVVVSDRAALELIPGDHQGPERLIMKRRHFISALALAGTGLATYRYWPEDGLINPCLEDDLPEYLAHHPLVLAAWQDIDVEKLWDCHVHLIGTGDSDSGIYMNTNMSKLAYPVQWVQRFFYINASCLKDEGSVDTGFVERLLQLLKAFPDGAKIMLLAFDYFHDERGNRLVEASAFYTPNDYARRIAAAHPRRFEWIASIHPYRADAVEALHKAVEGGARAVKWLPAAQGMDPASPKCDGFYRAMVNLDIPLLSHAGTELAVKGGNIEDFGNPLRLRRPLEQGVKVLTAHCASLGKGLDLDSGSGNRHVDNFTLFARMMDEPGYEGRLFGELSAVTQVNRVRNGLKTLVTRTDWHPRLINGSDYPLPGVMPLFSVKQLTRLGFLEENAGATLVEIRRYNPLLFDFVLKRSLHVDGKRLSPVVFESRRVFRNGS